MFVGELPTIKVWITPLWWRLVFVCWLQDPAVRLNIKHEKKQRMAESEGRKKTTRSLFFFEKLFFFFKLPSVWKAAPPLPCFTFWPPAFTSPQTHIAYFIIYFFHYRGPPPISNWFFGSLLSFLLPPLIFFSSPLFIAGFAPVSACRAKETPRHTARALSRIFPLKQLRHHCRGRCCSSLKVQQRLLS